MDNKEIIRRGRYKYSPVKIFIKNTKTELLKKLDTNLTKDDKEDICKKIGINSKTIDIILNHENEAWGVINSVVRISNIIALSKYLNVSIDKLFDNNIEEIKPDVISYALPINKDDNFYFNDLDKNIKADLSKSGNYTTNSHFEKSLKKNLEEVINEALSPEYKMAAKAFSLDLLSKFGLNKY